MLITTYYCICNLERYTLGYDGAPNNRQKELCYDWMILIILILFCSRDMQRLNMGKNKLNKIPHEALASLTYLEHLELSENPISVITPGDFNGIPA